MVTTTLRGDDKVSWSPSQLATEVDGEVVLLSIFQGSYYSLNDTGSMIWRKLREPIAVSALCDELGQEFKGDGETIKRDVMALLDRMLEDGLIQRAA